MLYTEVRGGVYVCTVPVYAKLDEACDSKTSVVKMTENVTEHNVSRRIAATRARGITMRYHTEDVNVVACIYIYRSSLRNVLAAFGACVQRSVWVSPERRSVEGTVTNEFALRTLLCVFSGIRLRAKRPGCRLPYIFRLYPFARQRRVDYIQRPKREQHGYRCVRRRLELQCGIPHQRR